MFVRIFILGALAMLPAAASLPAARYARFLVVGDGPPFRQEIRDGVRYELDPPPDSIPPREVVPVLGEEPTAAIPLRLGQISPPVEVPPGEGFVDLRKREESPEARPWLRVARPESGDFLVILFRSPAKETWKEPASLVINEVQAGTVSIVNLFPLPVQIAWGGESVTLPAGKTVGRPAVPGAGTPFQVLVADQSGASKRYFSGSITQNPEERGLVLLYRADGEAPRRPLKVFVLREPAPPVTLTD